MKVLSVKQPWAWLIVKGIKNIENRTWKTNFRRTLLIHASKNWDDGWRDMSNMFSWKQWNTIPYEMQNKVFSLSMPPKIQAW